jgi:hypothetical protein
MARKAVPMKKQIRGAGTAGKTNPTRGAGVPRNTHIHIYIYIQFGFATCPKR